MYKLLRIINQNRRQILIAILAIVFVIVLIQILNKVSKDKTEERNKNSQNIQNMQINTSTYEPLHSIISGGSISNQTSDVNIKTISAFIENCNNGKLQEAYEMLSTECKEELYPTIEIFKNNYYEKNFNTYKAHSQQLWITNKLIYKVELYEDALATGKLETDKSIQDYYCIVNENGEIKLNISEYIGKEQINKQITKEGITIIVNYKNIYKDYESYNITIQNNTENTVLIDSGESTKTMYLIGNTGINYLAYTHEMSKLNLTLNSYHKTTLNIKYDKSYNINNKAKQIVFSDIILNSKEYESKENKLEYKNRLNISIEL